MGLSQCATAPSRGMPQYSYTGTHTHEAHALNDCSLEKNVHIASVKPYISLISNVGGRVKLEALPPLPTDHHILESYLGGLKLRR